ncbi:hypothetical protein Cni_G18355 [Canna indica]|uniref:Transcription factor CBF/NF-Y/archaeal histone domain-containing protein n=1 Tax=Canna indica TaxID=4628 RepID=A0AAQ3KP77_9LILI|nr:hypothetical protein Cni_G18355 [Canna indica]
MAKERINGENMGGKKKEPDGRSPKGRDKGGEISMKKQQQQRKPKGEMEQKKKKKNKEEKKQKVVRKESKSRKEQKVAGDKKKMVKEESSEREKKKTKMKAGATEKEGEKKRTKTTGGSTKKEEKKKRKRKTVENDSSAAGYDEEGDSASCSFPMSRVRRLMRLEGGNTNVTNGISSDAVFLVNKASEMFLEKFVEDSYCRGIKRQKKFLSYKDLASNVHSRKRYEFLSDFVPEMLRAEDALKARTSFEA